MAVYLLEGVLAAIEGGKIAEIPCSRKINLGKSGSTVRFLWFGEESEMRVMQFVIDCPWPAVSGGDIRNAMFANCIQASAYMCVGLARPMGELPTLPVDYRQLEHYGSANPWTCFDPQRPICLSFPVAATEEIDRLVDSFRPTVLLMEGVAWGSVLHQLRERSIPTVLDMHNIESQLYADQIRGRSWMKRVLNARRFRDSITAAREIDRELSRTADQTWVCSSSDAAALQSLGGASIVVGNPIPDESLLKVPLSIERYRNPVPLFIGHLSYFPNVAAVAELANDFVPAMNRCNFDIRPIVAGRSPNRKIRRMATRGNIQLIADPLSCVDLLSRSGYTLLPIRHGSGTRIKVLEALAAGLVVIATGKAVEGLGLEDGIHYCRAETIADMSAKLRDFLAHPECACEMVTQGREFVTRNYSREAIQRVVADALHQLDSQN
ncbi:MAG: glycosyltransferase [Planctomycetota bacterium]|nr:glycosyltransferase [Planctomycetota bacterium]